MGDAEALQKRVTDKREGPNQLDGRYNNEEMKKALRNGREGTNELDAWIPDEALPA
jgi:hypothetical protein